MQALMVGHNKSLMHRMIRPVYLRTFPSADTIDKIR